MTTVNSATSASSASGNSALGSTLAAGSEPASEDRFLKMLVAQMQNQDPLNPLDNAEVTSQMAQINTVTGIDKLNTTIGALSTQFMQLQAMQGAALVGHEVAVEGDKLRPLPEGHADGGFELSAPADKVKIEITTEAGGPVKTIELKEQDAGRRTFDAEIPEEFRDQPLHFKVTATSGETETPVDAMALQLDTIRAVSTFGNVFALELDGGERVAYDAVWAFL